MGAALLVAKYLLKNYVINPLLKNLKRLLLAVLVAIVIVAAVVAIAAVLLPPPKGEKNTPEDRGGKGLGLREFLVRRLGLNKQLAVDLVSCATTLIILIVLIRG